MLLHTIVFVGPASALWALLPLVASRRLGLGASGYGLLLGALGAGAVLGAVVLPRIRGRWSGNALLSAASLAFAAVLAALVLVPNAALGVIVLIPAGMAWIAVLSGLNAAMQLFLPGWVRARGLSVYQIVFFGSQAAGAVAWGILAGQVGLKATFLIAAAVMAAGAATVRAWPLFNTRGVDRSLALYWPEPHLVIRPGRAAGPVLVVSIYTVGPENEKAFLEGMSWVRRSRLRTGAVQWGLFRDGAAPQRFVETFVVASWKEHSRQHNERLTGADREYEARVDALSTPPPETIHLIGVDVLEV